MFRLAMCLATAKSGETPDAFAGPAQGRLRVASGGRLDEGLQVPEQRRVLRGSALASSARTPQPSRLGGRCSPCSSLHLTDASADGLAGQTCGAGHGADAPATECKSFCCSPTSPRQFIQHRTECCELFDQGSVRCHDSSITPKRSLGYFISRRQLSVTGPFGQVQVIGGGL